MSLEHSNICNEYQLTGWVLLLLLMCLWVTLCAWVIENYWYEMYYQEGCVFSSTGLFMAS